MEDRSIIEAGFQPIENVGLIVAGLKHLYDIDYEKWESRQEIEYRICLTNLDEEQISKLQDLVYFNLDGYDYLILYPKVE